MGMYCAIYVASADDLKGVELGESGPAATATATAVSLEKAWHGLHFLLTGEAWHQEGPLAFLLAGGQQVGDDEESPYRWFAPEEASEINRALSAVSDDQLWSRFDAEEMEAQDIYPSIWDEDEEDLKEEYLDYFNELKDIVSQAVETGQGLLVSIG